MEYIETWYAVYFKIVDELAWACGYCPVFRPVDIDETIYDLENGSD